MSQLQKLLDEKYPLFEGMNMTLRAMHTVAREAFEHGYNAAMQEAHREFNEHMRQMEYMRSQENNKY